MYRADYITICDYITWLVILLKNTPSLLISARHNKNMVLKDTIWNIIDPNNMSKLTDLIDIILPMSYIKFADLTIFLSICTKLFNCCNTFS